MKKIITKYDIILIVFIILISSIFIYYNGKNLVYSNNNIALIYSNNKLIDSYILNEGFRNEFIVKTSNGYNTIKIEGNSIWVDDSSCPDKLCEQQGKINKKGQVIICLPNKLVIKITNNEEQELDVIS